MIKKLKYIHPFKIIVIVFILLCFLHLIFNCTIYLINQVYYTSNKTVEEQLPINEFTLINIDKNENTYMSTTEDSQLLLDKEMYVTNLNIQIKYQNHPGEILLYYSDTAVGEYSPTKRISFYYVGNNTYTANFTLPTYVYSIRIDPTMISLNNMQISTIYTNSKLPFIDSISFDLIDYFNIILYTLIISSLTSIFIKTTIKNNKL